MSRLHELADRIKSVFNFNVADPAALVKEAEEEFRKSLADEMLLLDKRLVELEKLVTALTTPIQPTPPQPEDKDKQPETNKKAA